MSVNSSPPRTVAVFGGSAVRADAPLAEEARELGRLLAAAGYRVCNGGYTGVMEAVSQGAQAAGGEVLGVTCAAFSERRPNPYLTGEIQAPDLLERIATLMRVADAYIVLDGNIGTLAELFLSWNLAATGGAKPIVVVGKKLRLALEQLREHTEIGESQLRHLTFVATVTAAAAFLEKHW